MRVKKGDTVKVLSGKDKGKTGEVLEIVPKTNKVVVKGEEGGIISMEGAMHVAKVAAVCPKCGKATKIGYSEEKGEKVRVCKKCGAKLK